MNRVWQKRLGRIISNWGIAFFGPLTGSNVASQMYHLQIGIVETLVIAAIASTFQTGFLISQEAKAKFDKES